MGRSDASHFFGSIFVVKYGKITTMYYYLLEVSKEVNKPLLRRTDDKYRHQRSFVGFRFTLRHITIIFFYKVSFFVMDALGSDAQGVFFYKTFTFFRLDLIFL